MICNTLYALIPIENPIHPRIGRKRYMPLRDVTLVILLMETPRFNWRSCRIAKLTMQISYCATTHHRG
ncbi:hypothetical protein OPQ81_005242 [Rhizoctonia solani]|nr:hypothetical protein OPQ81_005242 [Rhizoctonia solani]